VNFEPVKLP